jgi:hypothetical protein
LRAPATNAICNSRSPVSGDLVAFWAALSMAARFPLDSILKSASRAVVGVRLQADRGT